MVLMASEVLHRPDDTTKNIAHNVHEKHVYYKNKHENTENILHNKHENIHNVHKNINKHAFLIIQGQQKII